MIAHEVRVRFCQWVICIVQGAEVVIKGPSTDPFERRIQSVRSPRVPNTETGVRVKSGLAQPRVHIDNG